MANIEGYHPEFKVKGTKRGIRVKLSDWCSPEEVLSKLSESFGVETVGELVELLLSDAPLAQAGGVVSDVHECEVCEVVSEHAVELDGDSRLC